VFDKEKQVLNRRQKNQAFEELKRKMIHQVMEEGRKKVKNDRERAGREEPIAKQTEKTINVRTNVRSEQKIELEAKAEAEPTGREEEPDTEHEEFPAEGRFGLRYQVDEEVLNRMSRLEEI
jgi:hypothetical protein